MNWEAIGAIGQTIGAVAVVISLVYLATQIRNQNLESRLSSVHEILVGFRESVQVFISGDLSEIFTKANDDYDSLTNAEILTLLSGVLPMLRVWEEAFIQNEQGRLENRFWEGLNSQYSSYLNYAAVSRIWEIRGKHFDRKFQKHVNDVVKPELLTR